MQLAPLKADLKVKLKDTHIKEIMWVPGVLLLTGKCQLGSKKCGMLCEVKVKRDERMWLKVSMTQQMRRKRWDESENQEATCRYLWFQ